MGLCEKDMNDDRVLGTFEGDELSSYNQAIREYGDSDLYIWASGEVKGKMVYSLYDRDNKYRQEFWDIFYTICTDKILGLNCDDGQVDINKNEDERKLMISSTVNKRSIDII